MYICMYDDFPPNPNRFSLFRNVDSYSAGYGVQLEAGAGVLHLLPTPHLRRHAGDADHHGRRLGREESF